MNKAAIKKFAVESRQKLIKSTIERLEELGITDKQVVELVELGGVYTVRAQTLTETEKKNRDIIIKKIQEKGYESFVEEVAYTWFNRIIAIRYMEVNDYLPFRTRVLSSEAQGKVDPDLITEIADHIEELELNRDKVIELKEKNKQEELFKYVFIKVCNYLGQFLPVMFEQIEDYTELLLPSVMISNGSVIKDMIELVPEEDWTNQVEIIGWLYQYYIADEKDRVIKAKKKYSKEEISFATQLFTPKWIVKYMVENTLGRYWLENNSRDCFLKEKWAYYLENEILLDNNMEKSQDLNIEDVKCIDPACGSGHVLVYMFDILYDIYSSLGYLNREIPRIIIEKNLYGLEIDNRAYQLTYFTLIMKGQSYNRRFIRSLKEQSLKINIACIQETNILTEEEIAYIAGESNGEYFEKTKSLVHQFHDAKIYGSLIKGRKIDSLLYEKRLQELKKELSYNFTNNNINKERTIYVLEQILKQSQIMFDNYDILVTNPPYMGSRYMNVKLSEYVKKNYKTYNDLFASFIELSKDRVKQEGHLGFITPFVWMYISSYEEFRKDIVQNNSITSLIELEYNSFPDACVPVCTFTMRNRRLNNCYGEYIRLQDFKGADIQQSQALAAIENNQVYYRYSRQNEFYEHIPLHRIGYWINDDLINIFKNQDRLIQYIDVTGSQNKTSNNDKFLRYIWEVSNQCINKKWALYIKGGYYRKWYGNLEMVVDWSQDAITYYKQNKTANLLKEDYWFRRGLTYNGISNKGFSVRVAENAIYDMKGPTFHVKDQMLEKYILAVLNSKLVDEIMYLYNPTLSYQKIDVDNIPIVIPKNKEVLDQITFLSEENVEISKRDWDSYEKSVDFNRHPLILVSDYSLISDAISVWNQNLKKQFNKLKDNEERLNYIVNDIYGISNAKQNIIDSEIVLSLPNKVRDIKSFISYAVGCVLGRYSLDEEGLSYAGGEFDESKYQTFKADDDGIILISDTEYFEDDLLNRFVEFVKVVYGEETLEENLKFIADTECFKRKPTESARDCLRRYFLKGFMEDHLKVYQKRPIYWMFDSGKQNGFKALIYMHRYNEDMVAKVRTDYLHPLQRKYEAELERLDYLINFDNISTAEKGKAKKRREQIHKQLDECTQYDLLLAHVAHQRIPLNLDDGVKVNYQKFQNIELNADGSSKAKKGDLLYKVKM